MFAVNDGDDADRTNMLLHLAMTLPGVITNAKRTVVYSGNRRVKQEVRMIKIEQCAMIRHSTEILPNY